MASVQSYARCPHAVAALGGRGSFPSPYGNNFTTAADVAAAFNTSELSNWAAFLVTWNAAAVTAGHTPSDPNFFADGSAGYATYLTACVTAATTASYTPGTATGGIVPNTIYSWIYSASLANGTLLAPGT